MASISNLVVDQGTTFSSIITLTNQDGTTMNLTGYTVKSQFRKSYESSIFTSFNASLFNAATGQIQLQLAPADTLGIPAGRYLYDILITSPSGQVTRALEGLVILTPEITR
jgi:hypothetical protein